MANGASAIQNAQEAVVQSSCRAKLLLFFAIYSCERARTICVQMPMTGSSKRHLENQSVSIISPSTSDRFSTSPVCHESGSMICGTRQPQSRWQRSVAQSCL